MLELPNRQFEEARWHREMFVNARLAVYILLWALVGIAKTIALVLLLTAADTKWHDALAWLGLAFGLVAVALWWRARLLT